MHPIAFQDPQNSYKVKTFLTHFAIVLKTILEVFFFLHMQSTPATSRLSPASLQKWSNCSALSSLHAPEDTAGHLRWSPLREGLLWEKMSYEMQPTAKVLHHVRTSKEETVLHASACRPQGE